MSAGDPIFVRIYKKESENSNYGNATAPAASPC